MNKNKKIIEIFIVLFFVLISIFFQFYYNNGRHPYIFLSSDAAMIASFAAASDYPHLFKEDPLLGDENNFNYYQTFHIYYLRWMHGKGLDYGTAFHLLIGIHIFLHLIGFYLLGKKLCKNYFWAFYFTLLCLIPLKINLGEYVGVFLDPLPRFSFQTFLPFTLLLIFFIKKKIKYAYLAIGLLGLLVYAHPASAPVWGASVFLSILILLPKHWNSKKKILFLILLCFVYILVISPFMINYLNHHAHGKIMDYEDFFSIIYKRIHYSHFHPLRALFQFLLIKEVTLIMLVMVVACFYLLKFKNRENLNILFVWFFGILIFAVFIPELEHRICRFLKVYPLEMDLSRNIRYLVLISYMIIVHAFSKMNQLQNKNYSLISYLVGVLFFLFLFIPQIKNLPRNFNNRFLKKNILQTNSYDKAYLEFFKTVKKIIPDNSKIFTLSVQAEIIRYYLLNPVSWSWKDAGILSYTNHNALEKWNEIYIKCDEIMGSHFSIKERYYQYLKIGEKLESDYVILKRSEVPENILKLKTVKCYNGLLVLVKVKD
jgi:hypothetical protein